MDNTRAGDLKVIDLRGLDQFRNARYKLRVEMHVEDRDLDPRLRDLWTQRDVWRADDVREHLGWSRNSMNKLTTMHGVDYFPAANAVSITDVIAATRFRVERLPAIDFALNHHPADATVIEVSRITHGWESGLIMEWAYRIGRTIFSTESGLLLPNRHVRVGRAPAAEPRRKYSR